MNFSRCAQIDRIWRRPAGGDLLLNVPAREPAPATAPLFAILSIILVALLVAGL
ncbi:hypothetical protein P6F26_08670 [Roseibacterium sp. SDUM158017]|uniref:hypothetical protein n=1 Tax=Roseicyclus salinarum TaxID=3036773 RepID=UPI002414FCF7|nr:hypothetical protein [Roseibacterium sp. SDUM158017]MDG4648518.1 hypothetical protein [Roseibacterium sp. SDUM158017]